MMNRTVPARAAVETRAGQTRAHGRRCRNRLRRTRWFGWLRARGGQECWPNHYGLDMLAKNHVYDDSGSRRDLSWSPQVGSFDEGVMELVNWFQQRRHLA